MTNVESSPVPNPDQIDPEQVSFTSENNIGATVHSNLEGRVITPTATNTASEAIQGTNPNAYLPTAQTQAVEPKRSFRDRLETIPGVSRVLSVGERVLRDKEFQKTSERVARDVGRDALVLFATDGIGEAGLAASAADKLAKSAKKNSVGLLEVAGKAAGAALKSPES